MRTISIVNLKGGVGKTITAINMATILATEHQQRALLIDADSQGNASRFLLPELQAPYNTLVDLMEGRTDTYENLIYPTRYRNLDVLPADSGLMRADLASLKNGVSDINVLRDLRDALIEDDAYDSVIIDCPPSFSAACACAIAASTSIVIPVKLDMFSAEGMRELTDQIAGVRRIHPEVRISGCLITMWYNAPSVVQGEAYLRKSAPAHVYETVIRRTPKVDESTWMREALLEWSPQSSAGRDYRRFTQEYLDREEAAIHG